MLLKSAGHAASAIKHRCPSESSGWQNKLVIHQIGVGHGDGTFIRTPGGTTLLIDAGNLGRGRRHVLPVLKACYRTTSIDYVVVTHPHLDHYGGIAEVLSVLKVNKALYDTGPSNGVKWKSYEKMATETGKRSIPSLGPTAFATNDEVRIRVIAVNGRVEGGKTVDIFKPDRLVKDKNAQSIALLLSWGDFQYFTGGDLTGYSPVDVESPAADRIGDVDVMKSNHHGSKTANNAYFLAKLKPEVVIVSVGNGEANNRYRLPNEQVIAKFLSFPGVHSIFQTARGDGRTPASQLNRVIDAEGDVVIVAEPTRYSINGREFMTDGIRLEPLEPGSK